MPFGYSRDIFRYPPVQYIPLDPYLEVNGSYPQGLDKTRLSLFSPADNELLHKTLRRLNIEQPYRVNKGELALLVANGRVNLIQYRGYEAIVVGQRTPGSYHLFKITESYFYKDRLIFILYDGESSEKLDWKRYQPSRPYSQRLKFNRDAADLRPSDF